MKTKTLKLILAVSLLFNFTIIGAAGYFLIKERSCRAFRGDLSRRHAVMAKKLNLSEEQQKAFSESDAAFRKALESSRAELMVKRGALFALIKEDSPDRAAVDAAVSEISALQGRIEAQVVGHILDEKASLSKEQQEEYMLLLEKRFNRARHHREGRMGHEGTGRW